MPPLEVNAPAIDAPVGGLGDLGIGRQVDERGYPNGLERLTAKEAAYVGNVGGVDRPLLEYPLGWGEDALVDVVTLEQRA